MRIIWTENASYDYAQILNYLQNSWSFKVANNFIDEVDKKLETLLKNYDVFEKVQGLTVQKLLINKHITLFYKVEKDKIYLIHFWNNSQNPENLKF